ncbi:MAG TPA: glycosyltransferase family 4 protein [Methanotrichaceae archaeon]|nr:glycosyltransferase family 4 protein [Methanotrichaceae archaeon]
MKILQTPARFYPFTGGVENYVHNLSRELVEMGHEVTVLCANEPESKKNEFIDGIKVRRLPYIGKIANTNITPRIPIELLREDFDIIHTHLPTPWSADWSAVAAAVKGKPLVLTHHSDIVGQGRMNYIAKFYNNINQKLVLKCASKIIITNPKVVESSQCLKLYSHKIKIIPIGVDAERFSPFDYTKKEGSGENIILFISVLDKFHRFKGLDRLLMAMVDVVEAVPTAKLIVGGEGALLDYYKNMASSLGLEGRVKFLGYIPEDAICDLYNRCDLFVLPSISASQETFGIVLLEAMACARPVVGTEIVGVAEDVKRHEAGFIVQSGDENALADAIIKLLQDGGLRLKMGTNAREIAKRYYNWGEVALNMESLYEGLVKGK